MYTSGMKCHVLIPYAWEECLSGDECLKAVHSNTDYADVNGLPQEWAESIYDFRMEAVNEQPFPAGLIFVMEERYVAAPDSQRIAFRNSLGELHHEDGPAMEFASVNVPGFSSPETYFWMKHGKQHRDDGPAVVSAGGRKEWWVNGERHRLDGPAVITADGRKEWWVNGKRHREHGPAMDEGDGRAQWWVNGTRIKHRILKETLWYVTFWCKKLMRHG